MGEGRTFLVPNNWEIDFHGHGSNFRSELFRLIKKADDGNLKRLELSFPEEVAVYNAWINSQHGEFPASVIIY